MWEWGDYFVGVDCGYWEYIGIVGWEWNGVVFGVVGCSDYEDVVICSDFVDVFVDEGWVVIIEWYVDDVGFGFDVG